jgi:hypothetical protein
MIAAFVSLPTPPARRVAKASAKARRDDTDHPLGLLKPRGAILLSDQLWLKANSHEITRIRYGD